MSGLGMVLDNKGKDLNMDVGNFARGSVEICHSEVSAEGIPNMRCTISAAVHPLVLYTRISGRKWLTSDINVSQKHRSKKNMSKDRSTPRPRNIACWHLLVHTPRWQSVSGWLSWLTFWNRFLDLLNPSAPSQYLSVNQGLMDLCSSSYPIPGFSSAWHVLGTPELLQEIFNLLDLALIAVNARVCQQWSNLALYMLWEDVDDPYLLFKILAPLRKDFSGQFASSSVYALFPCWCQTTGIWKVAIFKWLEMISEVWC